MGNDQGKYKGVRGHGQRQGLGRLRRANTTDARRVTGLEREDEDSALFDRLGSRAGSSHQGETLLLRFNRVARTAASGGGDPGIISGMAGNLLLVRSPDGSERPCTVRQALKKMVAGVKNPLAVGDRVRWLPDGKGQGVIQAVEVRRNQLERADSHNRSLIHVFAANIDWLVLVASLTAPDLKYGLIDRYLVIAGANAIPAAVVINKADTGDPGPAVRLYQGLGFPTFATSARMPDDPGVAALRAHLAGATAVVAGQSGVGKSSLVNAAYPDLGARVGMVADAGHGRHTTTNARSYALPQGGTLIDTPGVRECGITGLAALDVALHYPDLAACQPHCHFTDCTHLHEPGCAVQAALAAGTIARSRYESYRSIVTEDLAGP